jgi:hypothetical protein
METAPKPGSIFGATPVILLMLPRLKISEYETCSYIITR